MPTIEININRLEELSNVNRKRIIEILENSKIEIEEIENEKIKLTVPAERFDLMFLNGLANYISTFENFSGFRKFFIDNSDVKVYSEKVRARKYFACFVVENLKFNEEILKETINFQELIHLYIGRDRKYVAIGIHDLDKIKGKIFYKEANPNEKFIPLSYQNELTLKEVLEITDKGRKYGKLISSYDHYPAIFDEEGIISFPPILNSERTKLTEKTKRIFVDITGTLEKAVEDTLKLLIYFFSFYGNVKKVYLNEKEFPQIEDKKFVLEIEKINKLIGEKFEIQDVKNLLERMGYDTLVIENKIGVIVPFYRLDVFNERDIIEDIAIAYGYNNFIPQIPKTFTKGKISKREKIEEKIRKILIGLGFTEIISPTFINSKILEKCLINEKWTKVKNPVSEEYDTLRKILFPSIMNFLKNNIEKEYPQKVFEIGYVVKGLKGKRSIGFAIASSETNLSEIISYIKAFFEELKLKIDLKKKDFPFFIKGRSGIIVLDDEEIGFFGEVHPQVLENFGIFVPITYCEIKDKIYSKI